MAGITKVYWSRELKANDDVNLEVEKNEIHAVVGENGAGKSTLMKVLYGLEPLDKGKIYLENREVEIASPLAANQLGIGMVHQHFKLIQDFTVAENVVLGTEPLRNGVFIDRNTAKQEVGKVIEDHGFSISPDKKISQLTVGQMQQVEIIKMLYRQVDLMILDEPTSVLTEQEIHGLFHTLSRLRDLGKTFILITHKLDEVMEISDRVTVMRKGKVVAVKNTAEVDKTELSKLMVGKSVMFELHKKDIKPGNVVIELEDVTLKQRGQARPLLDGVDLKVRSAEIVGVAGVGGNGLGELEDIIAGIRKPSSGRIYHNGKDITHLHTLELREHGLAYVPADRLERGSCLKSSLRENIIVAQHHDFLKGGIFQNREVDKFTDSLIDKFSIDATAHNPMETLSGGNIQKVIIARELAAQSDFIIFSEPTWGLDVGSAQFVYERILEMREDGVAVLLISSNLDEILGIADTIVVMSRGRVVCTKPNKGNLNKELIGEYMLGIREDGSCEIEYDEVES
jgi:simple sugar transport system ATP-binding protein